MTRYSDTMARLRARHGEKFSTESLDAVEPRIRAAFDSGHRVRVVTTYPSGEAWTRTGRVGITSGVACSDCAQVLANGTGGGDIGPDGREHYAAHARDAMTDGDFVLSGGCPAEDDGVCLVRHDTFGTCPLSCVEFSDAACMVCGTTLAGHRCPVVEFGVWDARSYSWIQAPAALDGSPSYGLGGIRPDGICRDCGSAPGETGCPGCVTAP